MAVSSVALVLTFGAWLYGVVNFFLAVAHRKPEHSFASFMFNGLKSFDSENFTETGQKYQHRMLIGFALWLVFAVVAVAVAASA